MPVGKIAAYRSQWILVLCAALGAVIAGVGDHLVKQGASATQSIAEYLWMDLHVGRNPEQGIALLFLVVIAALLTLVFDASSKRAAFAIGVGVLSTIFTLTPYKEKPVLPEATANASFSPAVPAAPLLDRMLGVTPAWAQKPAATGTMHLVVQQERGRPELTITILDLDRRRVVGRARYLDRTDFRIPLAGGAYRLTIESPGARPARGDVRIAAGRAAECRAWLGARSWLRQES